jgi:tRNA-Thr(GGU) m(6)t(6)A37 methyltransferase TsaA
MEPIGIILTPFTNLQDMPIQPGGGEGVEGSVVIDPDYVEGLQDLEGFSHIYLIYLFHRARRVELTVVPFMDSKERGVFATRSPLRPSHIGLSIVELVGVAGNILTVRNLDILNSTPLLDIKPYIAAFDHVDKSRSGWLTAKEEQIRATRADDRFV